MLAVEFETELGDLRPRISFALEPGERLAIVGPSGAGKTTVLRVIAGLLRPQQGRVESHGQLWLDTASRIDLAPERRDCSYLFQDYALFDHMTVSDNVAYGLRGLSRGERSHRVGEWLRRLGVSAHAGRHPGSLSGGERQRVALARAMAPGPDLLLLDEPLSALDAETRDGAMRELRQTLDSTGVSAILVTHDFVEASLLSDRIAVVEQGRVVQEGGADELAANPRNPFVAALSGAVVLHGQAESAAGTLTAVRLPGGARIYSVDAASGPVTASFFPWEVSLSLGDGRDGGGPERAGGSALNRVSGTVGSVNRIGNRARIGIDIGQPLVAEITSDSATRLGLRAGVAVTATWKASATRLLDGAGTAACGG